MNRRQFLRTALVIGGTAAGLGFALPAAVVGGRNQVAPSDRITVGCIGVGPQGTARMRDFLEHDDAQVVAVCDVKSDRLSLAKNLVDEHYGAGDCTTYHDFRDLLQRDDVDVILDATPDHWHVLTALAAVKAGKDVYLEKPMGLSLEEDQILRDVVHRYGRIFQFGTQQRSDRNFRFACELVRNGYIGELLTMNVWSPASSPGGPDAPAPVPEHLDYEFWLGPAPRAPYTQFKCSDDSLKKTWWFNSDYALGFIAGWGIHPMDIALWGGEPFLSGPVEIEGTGEFPQQGACDTAVDWHITLRNATGVTINFSGVPTISNQISPAGERVVEKWREKYPRAGSHGNTFDGTEGWVHVDRSGIDARPKSLLDVRLKPDEEHLYESPQHVRNFLDSVKSRSKTICPVDEAVQADIACHISDIAIRLGRKLTWDPEQEHFRDDETANSYLKRSWRSPWGEGFAGI